MFKFLIYPLLTAYLVFFSCNYIYAEEENLFNIGIDSSPYDVIDFGDDYDFRIEVPTNRYSDEDLNDLFNYVLVSRYREASSIINNPICSLNDNLFDKDGHAIQLSSQAKQYLNNLSDTELLPIILDMTKIPEFYFADTMNDRICTVFYKNKSNSFKMLYMNIDINTPPIIAGYCFDAYNRNKHLKNFEKIIDSRFENYRDVVKKSGTTFVTRYNTTEHVIFTIYNPDTIVEFFKPFLKQE